MAQLEALADGYRVMAWDAPGYGSSTPLQPAAPVATDYADALAAWLDALEIARCHLVGHSLGAQMACRFARLHPDRVLSLLIGSPASGYGTAGEEVQRRRRADRLEILEELGVKGMARERHTALLSDQAPAWARARVHDQMARLRPAGYRQAVELLVMGDIHVDARAIEIPVTVVVGDHDQVTPPEACRKVADSLGQARFTLLPGPGHACYVEDPAAFNAALEKHLEGAR